jgi:hypothetical protein
MWGKRAKRSENRPGGLGRAPRAPLLAPGAYDVERTLALAFERAIKDQGLPNSFSTLELANHYRGPRPVAAGSIGRDADRLGVVRAMLEGYLGRAFTIDYRPPGFDGWGRRARLAWFCVRPTQSELRRRL